MLSEQLAKWLSRSVQDKSSGSTARPSVALATDIGLVRKENQDRVACLKVGGSSWSDRSFFVVAVSDGMGGMKDGGECASKTIATFFSSLVCSRNDSLLEKMRWAANEANLAVYNFSRGYGGATLSAVLVDLDGSAISLNVGDSRIYAESGIDKRVLSRLTVDDSLEEVVGGHGRELLQFIGMGDGLNSHVKYITPDYDKLLITTDGVHFIHQQTMQDVFVSAVEPLQIVSRLSALARWSGAPDNATLAVCSIGKIEKLLLDVQPGTLEIWDSFSELHLFRAKLEAAPPSAISKEESASFLPQVKHVVDKKPDEVVTRSKRIARTRKKKVPKDTSDKLQIVIEMDASMEGSDDSAK
ncbi:PP2C family protein-serine/threonine phosphatase [Pseudomonas farris]